VSFTGRGESFTGDEQDASPRELHGALDSAQGEAAREVRRHAGRALDGAGDGAGARRRSSSGAQGEAAAGADGRALMTRRREKELRGSDGVNASERVRTTFFEQTGSAS
jgi:hypothetical protein